MGRREGDPHRDPATDVGRHEAVFRPVPRDPSLADELGMADGFNVLYAGNFSGFNGCTQVVASTIEWTGNTNLAVDCSAQGMG